MADDLLERVRLMVAVAAVKISIVLATGLFVVDQGRR